MNHTRSLIIYGAMFSAPLISAIFIPETLHIPYLVAGIVLYGVGFTIDMKSTISFGIGTVKRYETSPVFSRLCKTGFHAAIPLQGMVEVGLAVGIVFLLDMVHVGTFGACLMSFGGIHVIGWWKNTHRQDL